MSQGRAKNLATREAMITVEKNMREDFSSLREEFAGFSQQLNTILTMFSRMPNASLPADFPSRSTMAPILVETRT